jgi:predicted membrane protein
MEPRISEQRHRDHRLLLGVAIIVAGLLFLANAFGFLDYDIRRYIFRWEVVLMVLGVVFMAGHGRRSTGVVLFVIGGLLYLRDFFDFNFNFWQIFWPVIMITAGLMIILRHRLDGEYRRHGERILTGDDHIDEIALFGGGDRIVTSQQFQGGKVTTVFGGLNYNMLKAKLAPGENVIDVFCLFGGMKLIVPEGWTVKIRVMSFFGGFSDKHRFRVPETTTENGSALIIRGTVFFGGGEIKSYFD